MSIFIPKFDSTSGQTEWILEDDAFDYSQQIARSAYADMLHDTDRVSLFIHFFALVKFVRFAEDLLTAVQLHDSERIYC